MEIIRSALCFNGEGTHKGVTLWDAGEDCMSRYRVRVGLGNDKGSDCPTEANTWYERMCVWNSAGEGGEAIERRKPCPEDEARVRRYQAARKFG